MFYKEVMDAYLRHVARAVNGDLLGEDPDRDGFEVLFNPLLTEVPQNSDLALDVAVQLVNAAPDDESLAYIAAGPLQSVIVDAGPQVIGKVETLAQTNPRFRQALAAVGLQRAEDEVAARVRACRSEPW